MQHLASSPSSNHNCSHSLFAHIREEGLDLSQNVIRRVNQYANNIDSILHITLDDVQPERILEICISMLYVGGLTSVSYH